MPIHHHAGGTTLTEEAIDFFRLISARGAVQLECAGMRISRGPVQWKQAIKYYGLKAKTKQAVLAELNLLVEQERAKQIHTGI